MKHFLQRLFYLEKTNDFVLLSYYAFGSGCWVMECLTPAGNWATFDQFSTYEQAYSDIRPHQPLLICEELL